MVLGIQDDPPRSRPAVPLVIQCLWEQRSVLIGKVCRGECVGEDIARLRLLGGPLLGEPMLTLVESNDKFGAESEEENDGQVR